MDRPLAHYMRFMTNSGDPILGAAYQNIFPGETRAFMSVYYDFAPFALAGNTSSRGGDRGRATLVGALDDITIAIATTAILSNYLCEIKTVVIGVDGNGNFVESSVLTTELWGCAGGGSDTRKTTIELFSPFDAVQDHILRPLSQYLVGSLPSTGSISTNG